MAYEQEYSATSSAGGHFETTTVHAGDVLTLTEEQRQSGQHAMSLPQFELAIEINASALLATINAWAEEKRPSFTTLLMQAVGKGLDLFPLLNATFISTEQLKLHPHVNLAVAVETPERLQFPVVLDVNHQTVLTLQAELKRLTEVARQQLHLEETEGATFTLANLGMLGISEFRASVRPPQVAMLTAGAISYRLVMTGNRIINLPFFTFKLACDERVVDPAMAAKFLRKLKEALEE